MFTPALGYAAGEPEAGPREWGRAVLGEPPAATVATWFEGVVGVLLLEWYVGRLLREGP